MDGPLFTTGQDAHVTPLMVFDPLDVEFGPFDVDLAASEANTMVERFYSAEDSALGHDWADEFSQGVGWCNPPYSRGLQRKFIEKASDESHLGFTTVLLLPARTDTRVFHQHIWDAQLHRPRGGVEVRFLPGRIKFSGQVNGAPFPSMIVVFHGVR